MATLTGRRGRRNSDIWPGFVDALSTLLLVFIFLLSVFVLAQFFLGQALSGRDEALARLDRQVRELSELLSMERAENEDLEASVAQLSASLQLANTRNEELTGRIEALETELQEARARAGAVGEEASEREQQLEAQITALRQQIAALNAALEASERRDEEQQAIIKDLGRRLNVALAQKVQELAGYRSEFFGKLREVIGDNPNIRIVGDRFVFQSELLFPSGSAELSADGRAELQRLAQTLLDIAGRIPPDIDWILRVDGHTDPVPIATAQFPSNWHLSVARALSVVQYLQQLGVPPGRMAATGFGEYQPIDPGTGPEANRRNRRIEFKLTQR